MPRQRSPTPWSSATAGGGRSSTTSAPTRGSAPAPRIWRRRARGSCTPAPPACTRTWTPGCPAAATAGRRSCAPRQAAGMHTNLELVSLSPERMADVARPCLPYADSLVINELEAGRADRHRRAGAGRRRPGRLGRARGDGPRPDRVGRREARRGALPGRLASPPARAGGPGGRARSGWPARRCAARPAPATRSPPASSSACTRAGRSSAASGWARRPRRPASAGSRRPTASAPPASASQTPSGPATAPPRASGRAA